MAPLIGFIVLVIDLYIWVVIASAILSWLVAFNVVNTNNRFVLSIADMLYRLTEPALRPIRSILPNLGGSLPNDSFLDVLGLRTIWIPHSYAACSQHAPDEHMLGPIAREGLGVMAGLFWDLGEPDRPPIERARSAAG